MAIKHIVFDIDGTLVDTKEAFLGALRDALDARGTLHGDLTPYFSLPLADAIEDFGMSPEETAAWEADYAARLSVAPLYDGVRELLPRLAKRVRMALVTSRKHNIAHLGLEGAGMLHLFDVIIAADDVRNPKPASDPLDAYRASARCDRAEMIFIGDSAVDKECARNAGVTFYAPGWATLPDALRQDAVSIGQLLALVGTD